MHTHPGAGSFFPPFFSPPGAAQAQGLPQPGESRRWRLLRRRRRRGSRAQRSGSSGPAPKPGPAARSRQDSGSPEPHPWRPSLALTSGRAAPAPAPRAESRGSRVGAGGLMDSGRRRRVAVAGAARVLAGRNGSRSSSSRSCCPPSPLFLLPLLRRRLPAAQGGCPEREVSPSACQPVRLRAARLSPRRRRRRPLRQHRPRPLPAAAAAAGLGWLPARGSGSGRGLRSGEAAAGAAGGRCGAGAGAGAAARSAAAGTAAAARGLARPRRGDHAPFWLAPLRVPSALAVREAGFGAQPGAGGANHRRPSGRGWRVGEAGRPRPGTRRCSAGPRDPQQPRARPGRSAGGCVHPSVRRPRPPAVVPGAPGSAAAPGRRAARGSAAWPGLPPRRPRVGGLGRGELPVCSRHLRKLTEKFEN